jgi:hypothetical protein
MMGLASRRIWQAESNLSFEIPTSRAMKVEGQEKWPAGLEGSHGAGLRIWLKKKGRYASAIGPV